MNNFVQSDFTFYFLFLLYGMCDLTDLSIDVNYFMLNIKST